MRSVRCAPSRELRYRNEELFIVQQNVVEFWAVTMRPTAANGLELTTEQAIADVNALKRRFVLAPELPVQELGSPFVVNHRVEGKSTHDARLIAAMLVHGIEGLLTFYARDFLRYGEIRVFDE